MSLSTSVPVLQATALNWSLRRKGDAVNNNALVTLERGSWPHVLVILMISAPQCRHLLMSCSLVWIQGAHLYWVLCLPVHIARWIFSLRRMVILRNDDGMEVLKGRGMPFFFIDECKNRRVFLDPFVCYWSFITSGRGDALCAGWSLFASEDDCVVSSDAALGFVCLWRQDFCNSDLRSVKVKKDE